MPSPKDKKARERWLKNLCLASKGKQPKCAGWNKGLTKETDSRVEKNAKMISEAIVLKHQDFTYKEKYIKGQQNRKRICKEYR